MYGFQVFAFIFMIIFYLLLGAGAAFVSLIIFRNKFVPDRKVKYSYLEKCSSGKWEMTREIGLLSIVWVMVVMGITVFLIRSYIFDIPQLVSGKLNYVTAIVMEEKTVSKDPNEYILLSTGKCVKFFLSSDVRVGKEYKIGYLTHTSKALYCAELNTSDGNYKKLGFPFKDIAIVLGVIIGIFLIMFIGPYVRWKIFVPANIICLPTFLFFFIKYRIESGIWFSKENMGAFSVVMGVIALLMGLLMRYMEKRKPDEEYRIFLVVQIFALCDIGLFIVLIFNIK